MFRHERPSLSESPSMKLRPKGQTSLMTKTPFRNRSQGRVLGQPPGQAICLILTPLPQVRREEMRSQT
ncbi:hypothetical protein M413DRAFT_447094 [Hebeloma cylindrosporum]|uniref:Uncharacterized protein n=1 Tax=Hebeloma cylindrosporum TaxID=76867 RepID=A0A0C2XPU8_HEBCY|nr:hypothetical protein M413DRAFT_447094 [Hebeloma cylindrosporum h7]